MPLGCVGKEDQTNITCYQRFKMDEELRKLQELFSQAQEVKSTVRLSERNVIELVSKADPHCKNQDVDVC